MFYKYRQNNSGGSFGLPAIEVYIEADSAEEANARAEAETGIYFDNEDDCPCCGSRWGTASEWDEVAEPSFELSDWASNRVPSVAVYYANGEVITQ